ncbi:MAG: N-acetylmuramoyl-L-alanine amidase-like domain-containing protein [Longimicrobiales bacterium]
MATLAEPTRTGSSGSGAGASRFAWALLLCAFGAACGRGEDVDVGAHEALVLTGDDDEAIDIVYTAEDERIFEERMSWAAEQRLDTLPIGSVIARLGETFVGTTYTPGTLELDGPERLVVNLRELDCVTFVESVLAMARLIERDGGDFDDFTEELRRIRYRDGELAGYPSRLHYFSEWLRDNERKRIVREVTPELGGVVDDEPIDFMSSHRELYPKLAGDSSYRAILAQEQALSAVPRYYIPETQIATVADRIRDGDVIAATATTRGLDIAHTGFALWRGGRLHLMHAPLVGSSVEISEQPLAERILEIEGQDGIMVARPLSPTD